MEIVKKEFYFDSCVSGERIFVRTAGPEDGVPVRGIVQIAHGMAEHSLLYDSFMEYLAENGFFAAANDHLGHGKSVSRCMDISARADAKIWWKICTACSRSCIRKGKNFRIF